MMTTDKIMKFHTQLLDMYVCMKEICCVLINNKNGLLSTNNDYSKTKTWLIQLLINLNQLMIYVVPLNCDY